MANDDDEMYVVKYGNFADPGVEYPVVELGDSIMVRDERFVLVSVTHSCFQPTVEFMSYEMYRKKYLRRNTTNG